MKKGITFKEDIIKDLAKEMGLEESVVEDNVKFLLQRLKRLVKKEQVHGISIPKLGNLYFRPLLAKRKNDFSEENYPHKDIENRKKKVKDFYDRFGDDKSYSIQMRRTRFHDYKYNKGMTPKEMEKFQNNKADEYQKGREDN